MRKTESSTFQQVYVPGVAYYTTTVSEDYKSFQALLYVLFAMDLNKLYLNLNSQQILLNTVAA